MLGMAKSLQILNLPVRNGSGNSLITGINHIHHSRSGMLIFVNLDLDLMCEFVCFHRECQCCPTVRPPAATNTLHPGLQSYQVCDLDYHHL
jgi:hypothetical protein